MYPRRFFVPLAFLAAALGPGAPVRASEQEPASLLLFPCYDNTRTTDTLFTVTNTNRDFTIGQNGNLPNGTIDVEFVYINGDTCLETNRTRRLTPNDTISVLAGVDNPNYERGYLYVFAKRNGAAVSFNHLVGASLAFSGADHKDFEVAPLAYKAAAATDGALTDLDSDGRRDLNGLEYEPVGDELVFARFLGQGPPGAESSMVGGARSQLVLVNLAGARFTSLIDLLVYNDNEEQFSAQYAVDCWDRIHLTDINGVFLNDFLRSNTNHNPGEVNTGPGGGLAGPIFPEVGWFRLDGLLANSEADEIADPAVLAVLIDTIGGDGGAQLPWRIGVQTNGDLLNRHIFADRN